jgi:hypothetical protein
VKAKACERKHSTQPEGLTLWSLASSKGYRNRRVFPLCQYHLTPKPYRGSYIEGRKGGRERGREGGRRVGQSNSTQPARETLSKEERHNMKPYLLLEPTENAL